MKVSIFVKSWREDLKWLEYCLRFLDRHWQGRDDEIVVMLDDDEACHAGKPKRERFDLNLHYEFTEPWRDGYCYAMYTKCCADYWCQGDTIVLLDSDTMLLEPSDLNYFLTEGDRLVVPFLYWSQHHQKFPKSPWFKVRRNVVGTLGDPFHYMAMMPMAFHSSTFIGLREFVCHRYNKRRFQDAVRSDVPFDPKNFEDHPITICDYDCLGAFAAAREQDRYVFRHLSQMPRSPFLQFHSWTQWDSARHQLEERLHGDFRPADLPG